MDAISLRAARAIVALIVTSAFLSAGCSSSAGGGGSTTGATQGSTGPAAPLSVTAPGTRTIAEDEEVTLPIAVQAAAGASEAIHVDVAGLPPGARYDALSRTVTFRPDFTQGGRLYGVEVEARQGVRSARAGFSIQVEDTIRPPAPVVTETVDGGDHLRLRVTQRTDAFLDSPGRAGRTFEARIVVPKAASSSDRRAVRVFLHGFGAGPHTGGQGTQFAIYPHDPENTYWWGYAERLPGSPATGGTAPPYTMRRVLHLLSWLLETYPGADPERVYAVGGSMGGAGAALLGLLHARHFAYVEATIGQMVARNHRPSRLSQLEPLWGTRALGLPDGETGLSAWDRQDVTRALRDDPLARDQFIFTKHGKDDPTIHFGAVTFASPFTALSFYEAVQGYRVGHVAVWDEGAHGGADPVLGAGWWDGGWDRIHNGTTYLRRNLAFPAFSRSSLDDDHGFGQSNGRRSFSAESGYAGTLATAGDTGWAGAIAGALNRHLRWDATRIVDEPTRLEMPLRVLDGTGSAAPRAGYPTKGDRVGKPLPATVDVTVRRTQRFRPAPGEIVRWTLGAAQGSVVADADGAVTVPSVELGTAWVTLVLER